MKKAILIIAGLVIFIVGAAIIAPAFISMDVYKNQIKSQVEASTGRTLTIDGKLSIRFFPVAGITAENVSLSNPPGFPDKMPFITLSALTIDVAVIPLLHKEIMVKNFVLKEPVITMVETKAGEQNWVFSRHDMVAKEKPQPTTEGYGTTRAGEEQDNPAPASLPANLMFNNFEITNGSLRYLKGDAPASEVKNINASVVLQSSASAAALKGSMEFKGKSVNFKGGIGTLKSMLQEQKMDIDLTLASELFNAQLTGNVDKGMFTGKQKMESDSLKALSAWLAPAKPVAAPSKLAFQSESDLLCSVYDCNFGELQLILDGLNAKGSLKISWRNKPSVTVNLMTDELDITPFLPPEQKKAANDNLFISDALAGPGERWSSDAIDLSMLNQFNSKINIEATVVKFRNIMAGKTTLIAKIEDGGLTSDITNDNFYKGTATLSATINTQQGPPTYDIHTLLKSVALGPLLKDIAGNDNVTGTTDFQTTLKATGGNIQALVSSLSGNGQVRVLNGEIKHLSLIDMLHNVSGSFSTATPQNTVFTLLAGSFTVAQGVVTNHDLDMQTQGLNVGGDGSVNLPAYTVHYRLTPQLVTQASDATGASKTKEGLGVPVMVEGNLDAPVFRPDLASVVQEAIKNPEKLKQELLNTRNQIKDNKGELANTVKNILGLKMPKKN